MTKADYINFLKNWFPRNKAKGLLSQISFEEEFDSGFLRRHKEKFYPGCWIVSPKSFESNKFRHVVSVHTRMLDHDPHEAELNSILGEYKERFYQIARFLSNSSFQVIYAVPFSDSGRIDFSRIDSEDFSAVSWSLFVYADGSFVKKDPIQYFSRWRSGMRPRKVQDKQKWDNDVMLTSNLNRISEEKLASFVLKELFYIGLLKSVVRVSTDDPYDVDCFVLSSAGAIFPVELKEKFPVLKKYRDGTTNVHFFGIDTGRISCLERLCAPSDSNAFYVIREVDDSADRNLVAWKIMTLAGIVMASSWNPAPGGTGMYGSGTSTASLPYGEFEVLKETTFDDQNLNDISLRSVTVKRIADRYSAENSCYESI